MEQDMIFEPSADLAKSALIDANGYAALYQDSIANTDQLLADCPEFFQDETILVKGSRGMQLDRFVTSMTSSAGEATC